MKRQILLSENDVMEACADYARAKGLLIGPVYAEPIWDDEIPCSRTGEVTVTEDKDGDLEQKR